MKNLKNLKINNFVSKNERVLKSELVVNGDFSSDTVGWDAVNCTKDSIAGGVDGNCLELTMTGGTAQQIDSTDLITTVIGRSYQLTGYVKSGTSGNESVRLSTVNGVKTVTYVTIDGTTSDSWIRLSVILVATATTCRVRLVKRSATAGTMLFDKISLKEIQ